MGDGVDVLKYTPTNTNGLVWNWGIAAPTAQPGVVITPSGAAAVQWQKSTVFSTMGLIYDSVSSTVQQLNSVTLTSAPAANTQNSTIFGETGAGGPVWNQSPGGTTSDNTITWTNRGQIQAWEPNTNYTNATSGPFSANNTCIIYDPQTKSCYIQSNSSSGLRLSGNTRPNFKPSSGAHTNDGAVVWIWLGPGGIPGQWKAGHTYPTLGSVSDNDVVSSVSEPGNLQSGLPPDGTPIYWQTSGGGTSAASGTPTFGTVGSTTSDGDITWFSLGGPGTWAALTQVTAWSASGTPFTAIKDSNGNAQVCIQSGTTGTPTHPTWETVYGKTTLDGTGASQVVWVCVGTMMTWAANTIWELPSVGFSPPTSSSPFGGSSVIDTNGNVEFVISSGVSQNPGPPTWNTTVGGTFATGSTTDNGITWYNLEKATTNSLAWQFGHVYAYSYKARSLTDFYSVPLTTTWNNQGITSTAIPIPPGLTSALPPPSGSETGAVSSASPVFTITGPNAGAVNTISGIGSTDTQVDTIVIWRDADGGGSSNMFELTEIPAPKPINGVAQPWSFQDFLPDIATTLYPGLNILIPAPIDGVNDPPNSAFLPMAYNFQRIWGAEGQQVNFSGGPDTPVGNPNENFNSSDELPFLSNVIRAVKNTQGLVVYTKNSIEIILGGPLTASFYSVTLAPGVGLGNFNALDIFAGEQFFMDTTGQIRVLSPTLSMTSTGMPITDQLIQFNPNTVYIAFNEQPNDSAIYVGTGSSPFSPSGDPSIDATGWFRMNPRQVPGGPNGPEPVWSPFAQITGGCQMLLSIEVSPGVKKLLVGSTLPSQSISERNLNTFTDNGTSYDANFQIGNIWLAHRGEIGLLKFIEADFASVTTAPTVSYLLNEISGTFTSFYQSQFDPPDIYGKTLSPSSYNPLRFYFGQNASLAKAVHMQVGIDFGIASTADEIFNLTIYGAIVKGR